MSHDALPLDREQLTGLLAELSDELAAVGAHAQLFIVGGAAMALAYDESRSTRDVDAVFAPAPVVRQAGERVAARHGLEPDWLNDAALLFNLADYTVVDEAIDLLERTYPARLLLPRHWYIAHEVAERAQATRT